MFFKKKSTETDKNFLVKTCALLIHAAKIDESYTENEEDIIKKTIVNLITEKNINAEELSKILKKLPAVINAFKHKKYNVHGVQFHPESIKTKLGIKILKNFIKI